MPTVRGLRAAQRQPLAGRDPLHGRVLMLAAAFAALLTTACVSYPAGRDPDCITGTSAFCCADPVSGGASCACSEGNYACVLCANHGITGEFCSDPATFCARPNNLHKDECTDLSLCENSPHHLTCLRGSGAEIDRINKNIEDILWIQNSFININAGAAPLVELGFASGAQPLRLRLSPAILQRLRRGGSGWFEVRRQLAQGADRGTLAIGPRLDQPLAEVEESAALWPGEWRATLDVVAVGAAPTGWRRLGEIETALFAIGVGQRFELAAIDAASTESLRLWLREGGPLRLGIELRTRALFVLTADEMAAARTTADGAASALAWSGTLHLVAKNDHGLAAASLLAPDDLDRLFGPGPGAR